LSVEEEELLGFPLKNRLRLQFNGFTVSFGVGPNNIVEIQIYMFPKWTFSGLEPLFSLAKLPV
jgi:hypothetical protein